MTAIDAALCADLLRAITDQIAADAAPPAAHETVRDLIERVRAVSGRAKAALKAGLEAQYPAIGWRDEFAPTERQAIQQTSGDTWIYDPIDGAYHYLQGLPLWSASLALVRNGETLFALVYDPALQEMFIAGVGQGATLNGRAVRASAKPELGAAVLATALPIYGYGDPAEHDLALDLLGSVARQSFAVRQMGSASLQLAYVAAGRLDGYFEGGRDIHDWLAGTLLVREAGALVTDLDGTPFDWDANGIVAAPKSLSGALLAITAPKISGR
jgi:myo-inositol-1(or 4)-monophosphatase